MSDNSTPSTRFDGFTNDWEQHKLGELGSVTKGAALSKADISETGMPLILYGELYTTYSEVTYNVIRKTEAVVDDKYLSILGDILIPTSGETPEEISRATCVMVPNVILAGDLLIFRPTKEVDGRILSFILNHKLNNKIASIAQGKSIVHIQASELCQLRVTFPTLPEQKRIASLLSSVDETLDLCRRKLDLLTQAKKALMQQIFSRKLRFKADDGSAFPEWEEKKLGDVLEVYHGRDYKQLDPGNIPVMGTGGVITYVDEALCDWDCVCIGRKGTINKPIYMTAPFWSVDTLFFTKAKKNHHPLWQYYLFQMINWDRYNEATGVPSLNSTTIESIRISVPSLPEQKKIAACLSSADALIAQARAELEQWQEVKKSLLQQLFV